MQKAIDLSHGPVPSLQSIKILLDRFMDKVTEDEWNWSVQGHRRISGWLGTRIQISCFPEQCISYATKYWMREGMVIESHKEVESEISNPGFLGFRMLANIS